MIGIQQTAFPEPRRDQGSVLPRAVPILRESGSCIKELTPWQKGGRRDQDLRFGAEEITLRSTWQRGRDKASVFPSA